MKVWGVAKALDYSLKRWAALSRFLEDGTVPIDNNQISSKFGLRLLEEKTSIRQITIQSQRADTLLSLIQSARLNGRNVYAY